MELRCTSGYNRIKPNQASHRAGFLVKTSLRYDKSQWRFVTTEKVVIGNPCFPPIQMPEVNPKLETLKRGLTDPGIWIETVRIIIKKE